MKREKVLETILVLVLAFTILYWKFQHIYWLVLAIVLGAIGLLIPFIAVQIHWFWMKLGHTMGFIISKVLLAFIFFIIVFPLAVLSRIARKNAVQLKPGGKSYFKERNHTFQKEDLDKMW